MTLVSRRGSEQFTLSWGRGPGWGRGKFISPATPDRSLRERHRRDDALALPAV